MMRKDLTFRVFISSTFSDLIAERNALQENVFPTLRDYCEERGARFQAIDLRWGIGREAALDQQTMNVCMQELHRCQELSPRPNFIVLLGQRYGWVPLPPQINSEEYDHITSSLSPEDSGALAEWYKRDDNAVPPQHDLVPRTGIYVDSDTWAEVETRLKSILIPAVEQALDDNDPQRVKYFASATEQEIRGGALEVDDADRHVFCYFREIKNLPEDDTATGFRDLVDGSADEDAKSRLKKLQKKLRDKLPKQHIQSWPSAWNNGAPETDLDALCESVKIDLMRIIDVELEAFERAPELEREKAAHDDFGQRRSRHFEGRQDILDAVTAYQIGAARNPLVIYGKSGSGKTALMAKASEEAERQREDGGAVIIKRFVGATPKSTDLRPLLRSLCDELAEAYERGDSETPQDVNELILELTTRLEWAQEDKPLTIFLDALDQLAPGDNAHQLYWLPVDLPDHVKFVVSVLERDDEAGASLEAARQRFPESLVELGPLSVEHGEAVLDAWLAEAGRTLQPDQRNDVLSKFQREGLPLFLKLAFEEVRKWKSYDGLPNGADDVPGLGVNTNGILDDLFWRLELPQHHGKVLVRVAMQNLRTARRGLTEDELLSVLSMEDCDREDKLSEVISDYRDRSPDSPEVDALPVVIWSRLLADLEPYLVQRETYGASVWSFYHRQVGEAVESRYLSNETKGAAHRRLASYFESLNYWMESLDKQRERAKALPPTPRPANIRKVDELPHHLVETAKLLGGDDANSPHWDAVADLLTHWEFLEAKAEAQP